MKLYTEEEVLKMLRSFHTLELNVQLSMAKLTSIDIVNQAKEMQKEELEKELISFFLYFRNNGERLLGASIEQLVKSYLKSR
jgi:hypothetical protein